MELLSPVIADPEVDIDLFSLAALALGFVFVGTGKADIADNHCNLAAREIFIRRSVAGIVVHDD